MARVSAPAFWEDLYARGADGWETGGAAPALVDFVESTPPPRGRVLVPGCGRGHDARYLAARGYSVVGVDFSPAALAAARALAKRDHVAVEFLERDVFTLDRDPALARAFDGVWEYTCFCAIDPARRAHYVRAIAGVLRPGGWLLASFFPLRATTAGPPYRVTQADVRRHFTPPFRIERAFPPLRSPRGRQSKEWMVLARKTAAPA
ncbi:MAG: methyltransferase domain-containing protein [Candidatus Rokuibacteriota bacterium]